jgi:type 1 glutamine amidotransferase
LVRDLTDSMYNHRKSPYVSHFRGTELVVEHIEKFWCPSIASSDLLGGAPFQFKGDKKKTVALVIGENEYHTWETLPAFAREELVPRGYRVVAVESSTDVADGEFRNWDAIRTADLVVLSVRRRTAPAGMLEALRGHLAAGKPLVGIRTASHAFELRDKANPEGRTWVNFDHEVLGGDYEDHYGAGRATLVHGIAGLEHPILAGVSRDFRSAAHLYKSRNLVPTAQALLIGQTEDGKSENEPVAWVNTHAGRRVFYTSLGAPTDFADANFRRLLLNGILWSLDDYIPPAPAVAKAK